MSTTFLNETLVAKKPSPQLRISLRHSLSLGLVACPTLSRVSISGCSVGTIANERDETHERERDTNGGLPAFLSQLLCPAQFS